MHRRRTARRIKVRTSPRPDHPRDATRARFPVDHLRRHRRPRAAHAAALAVQPAGGEPVAARPAHPRQRAQRPRPRGLRQPGRRCDQRTHPGHRTRRDRPSRPAGTAGLHRRQRRRRGLHAGARGQGVRPAQRRRALPPEHRAALLRAGLPRTRCTRRRRRTHPGDAGKADRQGPGQRGGDQRRRGRGVRRGDGKVRPVLRGRKACRT